MEVLQETAYAKLNLALHVRRKRDDGYHDLETLFAFCEDGDVLTAEAADEIGLTIDGPFAEGLASDDGNLVIRAAQALRGATGAEQGARLHLIKNLPIASGIGGGSADAAAALRVLCRLWGVDINTSAVALALGADVPACVMSKAMRGEGVGEALTPLDDALAGVAALLVNPLVGVSTSAVFKAWDGVDRGALREGDDLLAIARSARNDLTVPALTLAPIIADVLVVLERQAGVTLARMSGSGASCFALFADGAARDVAHHSIIKSQPNWWTMATRLR